MKYLLRKQKVIKSTNHRNLEIHVLSPIVLVRINGIVANLTSEATVITIMTVRIDIRNMGLKIQKKAEIDGKREII